MTVESGCGGSWTGRTSTMLRVPLVGLDFRYLLWAPASPLQLATALIMFG